MSNFDLSFLKSEEKGRGNFVESIAIGANEEFDQVASAATFSVVSSVDSEFLERLRSGDAEAFDNLVTTYSRSVYVMLVRLNSNEEDAKDLTQETFLQAFRHIKNFRGDSDLKTWLFRIAINESKNRWRWWKKRKRDFTFSLDDENSDTNSPWSERITSKTENPEAETLRHERETILKNALQNLSQSYREVIVLRDIEGLSYEEIAETLATNIGTIKSRLARGRDELKKRLRNI